MPNMKSTVEDASLAENKSRAVHEEHMNCNETHEKGKKRTITTEQNFNVVKFGKCRSMSSNNKNESSRVASDEYSPCIKILRTDNEGNGDTHESSSSQALTATANANPNKISVENSNIPTKNVPAPPPTICEKRQMKHALKGTPDFRTTGNTRG